MHDWRSDVRTRLAASRLDPQIEAQMVEEIAQHLEAQFDELAPRIGADAARDRLIAELSDRALDAAAGSRRRQARRIPADAWNTGSVVRDLRYAARSLRQRPGMLAAGISALALGISLTTVMFSVIYGLLIKGLPFDDPARIAMIYRADPTAQGREDLVPFGDFVRYRSEQRSFSAFGGYTIGTAGVSGSDHPERVAVARVTAGVLDITGVRPMIGRAFSAADNAVDAAPTVMLGFALWHDRFAADSGIIGKPLRVDGRAYTVIGVMPDRYTFPGKQDLWLPIQLDAATALPGEGIGMSVVGRLRRQAGFESANSDLAGISQQLARQHLDTGAARTFAQPFVRATIRAQVYSLLYAMLGAVFLVLLVACANVANLLLDRTVNRSRDIAIRIALGASKTAVVRQSLLESIILGGLAAILGTGIAQAGITIFNRALGVLRADIPFWTDVRLHPPVLLFVVAVAMLASVISGVLPALHTARVDANTILKDESHSASSRRVGRLSRAIVVGEIALSSGLLVGAGVMTKSIIRMRDLDPRFAMAGVLTGRVTLASPDTTRARRFFEALEQTLSAAPGSSGVYLGDGLPGTGWRGASVAIEGRTYRRPRDLPVTRTLAVSPGFFRAFEVPLLRGRPILASDRGGAAGVAVINEAFARRQFPGVDPIGRRIRLGPANEGEWLTIVGVIPTLFSEGLQNHWPPEVLTALWQAPRLSSVSVALRGADPAASTAALRAAVRALDRDVPVYETLMLSDLLARDEAPIQVFGTMFVIFGIVSLVLAAIGLYAVMAFSVTHRHREMGIRMALGARNLDVVRLIGSQGATQVGAGLTLGFALGWLIVGGARAILFEVQPHDPTVFALVALVLGGTAAVACLIPALKAARVDPVIALRAD